MSASDTTAKSVSDADIEGNGAESNVVALRRKAGEELGNLRGFAREHPVLTVAGGLAVGLAVGVMARRVPWGRLVSGGIALAEAAGAATALLSEQAMEKVEAAGQASKDLGRQALNRAESAGSYVRERGENAVSRAGELLTPAEDAAASALEAGQQLLRKAADFVGRARN